MADKSTWNGTDRRMNVQDHNNPIIICKQEDKINEMSLGVTEIRGDVKSLNIRINGSLETIEKHIDDGDAWRKLIMGTAISLILSIIGGIYTASTISYNLGEYTRQIKVNTERISKIEAQRDGLRKMPLYRAS